MGVKITTDSIIANIQRKAEPTLRKVSGRDGRIGTRERERLHPREDGRLRQIVDGFGDKSPSIKQALDATGDYWRRVIGSVNDDPYVSARDVKALEKRFGSALTQPVRNAYELLLAQKKT